jgi:heme oxygenase
LNEIKKRVKDDIEAMAAQWSRQEKDECVDATAAAFRGGGMINSYLGGGRR